MGLTTACPPRLRSLVRALIALAILLLSCQSVRPPMTMPVDPGVAELIPKGLPELSALPRDAQALDDLCRFGDEFEASLPNNRITTEGYKATFSPVGLEFLDDFAYAIYLFDMTGQPDVLTMTFDWTTPPVIDEGDPLFWVALSNWGSGTWEWIAMDNYETYPIESITPYKQPESDYCYIVLLFRGAEECVFNSVGFPEGVPYEEHDPPVINMVEPYGGAPGEELLITSRITSTAPCDYAWDLGGGAEPNNPTTAGSYITLGDEGVYDCSLHISNEWGEDTYEFNLVVGEQMYFATGYTGYNSSMSISGVYVDLGGDLKMTAQSDSHGYFLFDCLIDGNYTVTTRDSGWIPNSIDFTIDNCYKSGLHFAPGDSTTTRAISGLIYHENGMVLSDVRLDLSGDAEQTAFSDGHFGYYLIDLHPGSYRVTPSQGECPIAKYFMPPYKDVEVTCFNVGVTSFYSAASPIESYTASGHMTLAGSGLPVEGITVRLAGPSGLNFTTTDSTGYYEFTDVPITLWSDYHTSIHVTDENAPASFFPLNHVVWDTSDTDDFDFEMTLND